MNPADISTAGTRERLLASAAETFAELPNPFEGLAGMIEPPYGVILVAPSDLD